MPCFPATRTKTLHLTHQQDIVQVLQAAKQSTSQPATWGEGDWDGAPGGSPGNPPFGDGVFTQPGHHRRPLRANTYLTGSYAAVPVPEPNSVAMALVGLSMPLAIVGTIASARREAGFSKRGTTFHRRLTQMVVRQLDLIQVWPGACVLLRPAWCAGQQASTRAGLTRGLLNAVTPALSPLVPHLGLDSDHQLAILVACWGAHSSRS